MFCSAKFENMDNLNDVVDGLKTYGIVIVKNYLTQQLVEKLKQEFCASFKSSDIGIVKKHKHPVNDAGKVVRIKREKLSSEFSTIKNIFGSSKMEGVVRDYYAPNKYLINDDVFLTHEKSSEKYILPWHFDRQQSLKFFIYLTDTTEKNGAFEYCPGSHMEGHYRASYYVLRGYSLRNIPNDIPEEEVRNPVIISAKAGDLIIFDADGFHRGGRINEGHERLVIRGHSHPIPNRGLNARLFSKEWWMQTPLNMGRVLGGGVGRVLGDRSKSQAVKTRKDVYKKL